MAQLVGCIVIGIVVYCLCHAFGLDVYHITVGETSITLSFILSIVVCIYTGTR